MSERMFPELEMLRQRLQKLTTFFDVAFVARLSISQDLREVRSWHSPIQPTGPPLQKMILPFILWNLKSRRRVPSATALPIWEPQQASLYAESVDELTGLGGTASSWASASVEGGKWIKECIGAISSEKKDMP
jgi:hypothetical protein